MKMKKILLALLFFTSCSIALPGSLEYSDFTIIGVQDVKSIKSATFYLFFYLEKCSFCQEIKEEIFRFADKKNDFYFLDCRNIDFPLHYEERITFSVYGTPTLVVVEEQEIATFLGVKKIRNYLSDIPAK